MRNAFKLPLGKVAGRRWCWAGLDAPKWRTV